MSGTATGIKGAQLPAQQTALVVSEALGPAQLYIYGGNHVQNGGSGYVGLGVNRKGAVTIDGVNSMWANDGDLAIGAGGAVSAGGEIAIGEFGSVRGNGTLSGIAQNSGTIAPGLSVGSIAVAGGYSQSAGGNLDVELAGSAAGQFDVLVITGAATLNATLNVTLESAFVPQLRNTFNILTAYGATG
jgi:T5SS/PEP-CTERM-associated repeat protein